jgi:arabinogalactan endo-1,4-beta-galactosidase
VYAYAKIDGESVARADTVITSYNDWHSAVIDKFDYAEGQELVVGIYVQCHGEGNGAWGKIDDAMLNSVAGSKE